MKHNANMSIGSVITFYSYKGGVGRSMALANVARCAALISERTERVLVIDWDLDAPGLHRFFPALAARPERLNAGLIDYFLAVKSKCESDPSFASALYEESSITDFENGVPLDNYIVRDAAPGIDIMLAGQMTDDYPEKVLAFPWADFYEKHSTAISLFREAIKRKYKYSFVDSRTGYTDVSGICTALLPEKLVVLFVPNEQNLAGVLQMTETAVEYRRGSNDTRPLAVFPVASRIDQAQQAEKVAWLLRFQYSFESLFTRLYDSQCDLSTHFDTVQLPNVSYYSYGEHVAMLDEERSRLGSLRHAYEAFASCLFAKAYPWESENLTVTPSH